MFVTVAAVETLPPSIHLKHALALLPVATHRLHGVASMILDLSRKWLLLMPGLTWLSLSYFDGVQGGQGRARTKARRAGKE